MPGEYVGAGRLQLLHLSVQPLWIGVSADDHGDHRQGSTFQSSRCNCLFDGRSQFTGRVHVRPIAQHDIQNNESCQAADSQFVVKHGMQPSYRERVPT